MGWGAWDYAKIIVPVAAGIVGTPVAGAATAALMNAGETKAKGGSWADAAKSGAIAGGTSYVGGAALGGLAGGAGGQAAGQATGEAAGKAAGSAAGKAAAPRFTEALGMEKVMEAAIAKEGGKQTLSAGLVEGFGDTPLQEGINQTLKGEIAKNASDAAGKARFLEHVKELAGPTMEKYGEVSSEKAEEEARMQQMFDQANSGYMRSAQNSFGGVRPTDPWVPSYRR